jgi:hypothetical protein
MDCWLVLFSVWDHRRNSIEVITEEYMRIFDTTNATPGQRISEYQHIGGNYFVYAIWTRFNTVSWFVEDRETADSREPTLHAVVKQCDSYNEAIKDFTF